MAQDSDALLRDRLLQRPIKTLQVPTITADKSVTGKPLLLVGWSFRETTGSATAAVELEASQDTAGPVVGEQAMASGGTGSQVIADEGVLCASGLLVHVLSGSVRGCVWVRI